MQRAWVALATIALCCGAAVAASGEASAPTLIVESGEEFSQVFVEMERPEGEPLRVLLRQTTAKATPGRTAASEDGAAAFANWNEEGATFTSFTRDGGQSWTEARRLGTDLMLQAGRVAPGATMPSPVSGLEADASTGVFVVQLASQSLPEWRSALEAAGAEIVRSIPYNAHVVQLDPSLAGVE